MLLVVGGIIGGVVAVGLLLLLLWKLLTFFFDKMEYARFMREIESYKWAKVSVTSFYGVIITSNYTHTFIKKIMDDYYYITE